MGRGIKYTAVKTKQKKAEESTDILIAFGEYRLFSARSPKVRMLELQDQNAEKGNTQTTIIAPYTTDFVPAKSKEELDEMVDRQLELMKERLLSDEVKSITIEGFSLGGMHAMAFVAALARLPKDERGKITKKIQSLQLNSPLIHTGPSIVKDIMAKILAFFMRLFNIFSTNPSVRRYVNEIEEKNGEGIIPQIQLCYSKDDPLLNFDDKTTGKLKERLGTISTVQTHDTKDSQHQICTLSSHDPLPQLNPQNLNPQNSAHLEGTNGKTQLTSGVPLVSNACNNPLPPSISQNFTDIAKATDVQKERTQTMPNQSRGNQYLASRQ